VGAALAAALVGAMAMLIPAVLGYDRYVITGGSMAGTYDRGSVVFAKEVPTAELRVGDVITYAPPPDAHTDGLLTHRIVSIRRHGAGPGVLRTKGDANRAADPWRFKPHGPVQARAALGVPYLGYAFAALSIREVRMLVIGLPALIIALALLIGLWRQAGEEVRPRAGAGPPAAGEG
jgi:signal peptidase I